MLIYVLIKVQNMRLQFKTISSLEKNSPVAETFYLFYSLPYHQTL